MGASGKGLLRMANKKKKTSITVDSDDFEEQLRILFNNIAEAYEIPRGRFLSRALYLACQEILGDIEMKKSVDVMQKVAQRNAQGFKEEAVLDTKAWKQLIPFFQR